MAVCVCVVETGNATRHPRRIFGCVQIRIVADRAQGVAQFVVEPNATQICGKGECILECIFGRVDNKASKTRSKNRFTIVGRTIFDLIG